MQNAGIVNRYIVARDSNVVRVNFNRRDPDPPAPTFPGAGALRQFPGNDAAEASLAWPQDRARQEWRSVKSFTDQRNLPRLSPL